MYKLDYTTKDPIYQQIVDQTKIAIAKEYFKEGDQLPSVRELAKTLQVNQSTITRAFKEMEILGMIQTVTGKGTFVVIDEQKMKWEKEKTIEKIKDLLHQCYFLGITSEEIIKIFDEVKGENK